MSFQQGLSGLNGSAKNLEVIGNNIANANTFGSKVARAEFADMYAASLSGAGGNSIGIGVNLETVAQQFTQGNLTATESPMDLAINGGGFFQLSDERSPPSYTRNGQFKVDRDGFIVSNGGLKLIGYVADETGAILPGAAKPLKLPTSGIAPDPTTEVSVEMNLDARKGVTAPAAAPLIDFSDPLTFNNATSLTLYDEKGQDIAVTYYFQKAADDTWNVFGTANGEVLGVGSTPTDPQPMTTLTFSADGKTVTTPVPPIMFDVPVTTTSSGANTLALVGVELDLTRATQYGAAFGVTDLQQDGFTAGQLSSVLIEADGTVLARYSNGETKPAGQIELATFRNPQGLIPMGGNNWGISAAAGEPVIGPPKQGTMGAIQSGALEESNIDLTGELVAMITAQRTYQANAQTIKTEDQVLQTLVNLR
jgi:flagellar hook protein FlgE